MSPSDSTKTIDHPPLEVGWATDPGREPSKQINEDSAAARETPHGHLAVVCDGMGGHVGGREASQLAIETIFRVLDATPPGVAPAHVLAEAIREANRALFARGEGVPELKGMGSTCVAVLTHAGGSEIAHVGDSRVYLLTQQQVYQVTKDHSLVQRLVDANMLTPEQASNHPSANQITNALGMKPDVDVEVRPTPFASFAGDTFVLCSDGLSDECGPQDFLRVLAPHPPCAEAARVLCDLANARGGHDNITVIIVRVMGGGPFVVSAGNDGRLLTPLAYPLGPALAPTPTLEMETASAAPQVEAGPPPSVPPAPAAVAPAAEASRVPVLYAGARTPLSQPAAKGGSRVGVAIFLTILLVAAGVGAALYLRGRSEASAPPRLPEIDSVAVPSVSEKTDLKPRPTVSDEATTVPPTASLSVAAPSVSNKPPPKGAKKKPGISPKSPVAEPTVKTE